MASLGQSAFGTTLSLGATAIAELKKIGISMKQATIDITNHDSPGRVMEFVAGLIDAGTIAIAGNWLGSAHTGQGFTSGLGAEFSNGTVSTYTITFSNSSTVTFTAMVESYGVDADYNSALDFKAGLKIASLPVWA